MPNGAWTTNILVISSVPYSPLHTSSAIAPPATIPATMVILYQSQTCPINPPSASPILNIDEFWEVMMLKCRKPELFVEPMSGSKVLEENSTFMKRSVTFKEGMGPPGGEVIEDLQIRKPWKVPPTPFPHDYCLIHAD